MGAFFHQRGEVETKRRPVLPVLRGGGGRLRRDDSVAQYYLCSNSSGSPRDLKLGVF